MHITSRRARARAGLAAASLALVTAPAAAHAQLGGINPFSFGVSAGAVIPAGDARALLKTGFSVDGIVAVRVPTLPVSFRGEVGYARFGFKGVNERAVNFRYLSGVANVVLTMAPPASVLRPYLIGGVGVYNGDIGGTAVSNGAFRSETKAGLNGGVGVEIPLSGITGFGEVRYTRVFTDGGRTNFVPVRFGIRF